MSGRRLSVAAAVVVILLAAAAVVAYVVWPRGSELERAAGRLPEQTLRVAWTDWAGIRAELDAGDLDDPAVADEFLLEAGDADLSSTSAIAGDGTVLAEQLGFSPQTSDWELLGQSREGMVLMLDVGDETDLGDVADKLESFGYQRPSDDAMDGAVWQGGPDVVTNVPGFGNPVLQHVAFFEDDDLLVASDNLSYLESAVPVARGDEDGLDLEGLAADVDDPLSSIGFIDDYACEALSMSAADEEAQAEADAALEDVGGVAPLSGYLVALGPGGELTVVLGFADEAQAERNEDPRTALAQLEDPGQMVSYPDVFEVEDSRVEDNRVVIDAHAVEDAFPLSNLTQGPVLLASC